MSGSAIQRATIRSAGLARRLFDAAWVSYAVGSIGMGAALAIGQAFAIPTPFPEPLRTIVSLVGIAVLAWPPLLVASFLAGRARSVRASTASVADGALQVGALSIPRSELAQGAVLPTGGLTVTDRRGRELVIETEVAKAAALLDALDLEPEMHRYRFAWRNRKARIGSFVLAIMASSLIAVLPLQLGRGGPATLGAIGFLLLLSPYLIAELVSRWWARRELTVGLDAVEARSRRGQQTIRLDDIRDVTATDTELVVTTKDGSVHRMFADFDDAAMRPALLARIREARAVAASKKSGDSVAAALLARGEQSVGDWRRQAASILTAATGFRAAAVEASELASVLEDASAPAEQRIAAAIALGADPENRPRIRVAADASASPQLRVALDALAEGETDDAVLERALAEAER